MAPEEIEADIQHFYPGRHLREWYCTTFPFTVAGNRGQDYVDRVSARNEGMTSRELHVLIEKLPEDSQTSRKLKSAWTTLETIAVRHFNAFGSTVFQEGSYEIEPGSSVTRVAPRYVLDLAAEEAETQVDEQISDRELQAIVHGDMNLSDLT
jgi:hypothetical protein